MTSLLSLPLLDDFPELGLKAGESVIVEQTGKARVGQYVVFNVEKEHNFLCRVKFIDRRVLKVIV